MGITLKKYLLPILSFTLLVLTDAEAIDVSASGVWADLRVDESNLIAGPGTDLTGSYESDSVATLISVSDAEKKNDDWKIRVSINGSSWPDALSLYMKRTSGGTDRDQGHITGGLSYQKVTNIETDFFTGKGERNDIAIQYMLTGMSITIDPGNYSTTITFTIIGIK